MKGIQVKDILFPANQIIIELLEEIEEIDSKLLIGFYVVGSLALEDFYDKKSDIDFVAICRYTPDDNVRDKLERMHKQFNKFYPKPDLSGCYLTTNELNYQVAKNANVVTWHDGSMRLRKLDMLPILLFELKKYSKCIFSNETEFKRCVKISQDEVDEFMHENLNSYWRDWLKSHSSVFRKWLLLFLFPRKTEWCILGIARQLCTLVTGEIVSKKKSGEFCLTFFPETYHEIIQEAIRIREDNRSYPIVRSYAIRPSLKRARKTLACANYEMELFNKSYRIKLIHND